MLQKVETRFCSSTLIPKNFNEDREFCPDNLKRTREDLVCKEYPKLANIVVNIYSLSRFILYFELK